jgi:hypothetical protein
VSDRRPVDIANFNQVDDSWVQTGGLWTRCIFIGKKNSPDSPVGVAIKADREIGDRVAGKRSFDTTTMTVVLSGTVMHDDRWLSAGDFYVSPPNEVSGDLVFGSEGATIFIMFDNRSGMIPKFANEKDQANFDKSFRKDVEATATGQCEKTVPILPLRDEYTKGRAVVFKTLEEVEEYRQKTGTEW